MSPVPAVPLSIADYRALAEFRYRLRCFLHFSERAAREAGLEPQQHQLLLALKGLPAGGRATVGLLAERLQLRHHSAVELIDRTERRGLVRRGRDPDDHRQVVVRLTPRSEQLLPRLARAHRLELRATGPALLRALATVAAATEGVHR